MTSNPRAAAKRPAPRLLSPLRDFLAAEAAGSTLLALGALGALVWANSPWSASYHDLWDTMASIGVGGHELHLDLRHWVDEAAMTLFFLVVGLEIKREVTSGDLRTPRAAALPAVGAVGGMVVPALLYLAVAGHEAAHGWAVPVATDIALSLGVLAIVGDRITSSVRAFLLGLAIVDDVCAVLIIAIVYSDGIHWIWMGAACLALASAVAARRLGVGSTLPYVVLGTAMWLALHQSGVHATIAGVAMGLLAPSTPRIPPELVDVNELNDLSSVENARATSDIARGSVSVVEWLLHTLHPWTSYLIVPVFALANAGIEVSSATLEHAVRSPVSWGILAGLVVGKPVGILLAARAAKAVGIAEAPPDATGRALLGTAAAAGIGFTVAVFVSELAFDDPMQLAEAKLAILAGSVLSAGAALVTLRSMPSRGDGGAESTSSQDPT